MLLMIYDGIKIAIDTFVIYCYYDSGMILKILKVVLAIGYNGIVTKSDAGVHLSTIDGKRSKAPEHKGKLESLVGNVDSFAPLQDWCLVQEKLEEESKGEDNPIPEQ